MYLWEFDEYTRDKRYMRIKISEIKFDCFRFRRYKITAFVIYKEVIN